MFGTRSGWLGCRSGSARRTTSSTRSTRRAAAADRAIKLTIFSALTLEKTEAKRNLLEQRFIAPVDRAPVRRLPRSRLCRGAACQCSAAQCPR